MNWQVVAVGALSFVLVAAALGVFVVLPILKQRIPPGAAPVLARVASPTQSALGFEQLDVTASWRFAPDPSDLGKANGWAAPSFDDSRWDTIDAGDYWQNLGYPGINGVGWYRRGVVPPADWQGKPVYLWLDGVDDEFDLYVNGKLVGHYGDRAAGMGTTGQKIAARIDSLLKFGEKNAIAVRVNDWGGLGGLGKAPVVLSTSGNTLVSSAQYLSKLAALSPDAAFPDWTRGADRAWTVAGGPGGSAAAIVGGDGTVSPNAAAFTLTYWVYDPATKKFIAPERVPVEQRLQDGYQPTPITTWREDGLEGESTALVTDGKLSDGRRQQVLRALGLASSVADPALLYRVRLTEASGDAPRKLVVVAALRPYGANGQPRWIGSVEGAGDTVKVNGQLALVAGTTPAGFGATSLASRDLSTMVQAGEFPSTSRFVDPQGLATIGLEYPITVKPGEPVDLTFKMPLTPTSPATPPADAAAPKAGDSNDGALVARLRELQFDDESLRMRAQWQSRLQSVSLDLPDSRYSDAFYASLGYLLVNMRGNAITSGPFAHLGMWYRDASYVLPALLKAGVSDGMSSTIARLTAGQMPSGELPPALDVDGSPRWHERHEWDAQGEYIYTVAETYRMTHDQAQLEAAYPSVVKAADFAIGLSKLTRTPANEGTPFYGLVPAGDSAEDLGPREDHHYWDDFWTIGGLREAAGIASALGKAADADRFSREAADLQDLTMKSIQLVQKQAGIDYIPNGPEDTTGSSMARGTTPAVWPLKLFAPDDPLIQRSFATYLDRWVLPQSNGYMHNSGNLWIYGGLEIAHSEMFLWNAGTAAGMAQWVVDNQTLPGTYAWAEAAKPITKRFSGGDMPHSWAAAEYVLYLRDGLVREDGDQLVLGDAIPASWMDSGQRVEIHHAPTYFGTAGYSLVSHVGEGYWELTIDDGTAAPGGYLLRGPFPNAPTKVVVDGREIAPSAANMLSLPKDAKVVRVYFK